MRFFPFSVRMQDLEPGGSAWIRSDRRAYNWQAFSIVVFASESRKKRHKAVKWSQIKNSFWL